MLTLEIAMWKTQDPQSPGWLFPTGLRQVLLDPTIIPAQFFDRDIMENYIIQAENVVMYTSVFQGFVDYIQTAHNIDHRFSVLAFDSSESFNTYTTGRSEQLFWPQFIAARQDLLNLLKVNLEVVIRFDVDLTYEQFAALTDSEIQALIVNT